MHWTSIPKVAASLKRPDDYTYSSWNRPPVGWRQKPDKHFRPRSRHHSHYPTTLQFQLDTVFYLPSSKLLSRHCTCNTCPRWRIAIRYPSAAARERRGQLLVLLAKSQVRLLKMIQTERPLQATLAKLVLARVLPRWLVER